MSEKRKDNRGRILHNGEVQIQADLFDHIASNGGNMTVLVYRGNKDI